MEARDAAEAALKANKEYQSNLMQHLTSLKEEMDGVDKLLADTEGLEEDEDDMSEIAEDSERALFILGGEKVQSLLPLGSVRAEGSQFYEDVMQRKRYLTATTLHNFSDTERKALRIAVIKENKRIYAEHLIAAGVPNPLEAVRSQPDSFFEANIENINWDRVVTHLPTTTKRLPHTASDCKVQWISVDRPSISKEKWSEDESSKLKSLIKDKDIDNGDVDWVEVASTLNTNRTALQCYQQYLSLESERIHKWTTEEDQRLLAAVKELGTMDWPAVALHASLPLQPRQLQYRYLHVLNPSLSHGPWSREEDEQLRKAVETHGTRWGVVKEYVHGRTEKMCRDRWVGGLSVVLRGWSEEEEDALREAKVDQELTSWDEIATHVGGGRTAQQCLRHWEAMEKEQNADLRESGKKRLWKPEEDAKLREAKLQRGLSDWKEISAFVDSGRSATQCKRRWGMLTRDGKTVSADVGGNREWTETEDAKLRKAKTRKLDMRYWTDVATYMGDRSARECELRWASSDFETDRLLATTLESERPIDGWEEPEDAKLIEAKLERGLTDWDEISEFVGTRTVGQCIRRWSFLRKRGNVPSTLDAVNEFSQATEETAHVKATQPATSESPFVVTHEQPQNEDQDDDSEMQPRREAKPRRTKQPIVQEQPSPSSSNVAPTTRPRPKPKPRSSKQVTTPSTHEGQHPAHSVDGAASPSNQRVDQGPDNQKSEEIIEPQEGGGLLKKRKSVTAVPSERTLRSRK